MIAKVKKIEKLTRDGLVKLCCDGQEQIIARHVPDVAIEHINRFPTNEERQFALRCFWIPFEMIGIFEKQFLSPKNRYWNVWQFAPVVAHGRMLKEMLAWDQDPRVAWWTSKDAVKWWMERYDSYLRAIEAAHCHWMKRKCPDCFHEQPDLAAASRYGFVQRVDIEGLHGNCASGVLAGMKERGKSGSRESEFFHKNANPSSVVEPRWDYPDIDLWLIEVWPLVRQCHWTYPEIYRLVLNKFGEDDGFENAGVLKQPNTLKERCEMLGLQLSPIAQERRGRPKKDDDEGLENFGAKVYALVAKRVESPDPEIRSRGATAYQRLAEMAVNIEPFTNLFSGTPNEKLSFACPNLQLLKLGGKKLASSPPFFVSPSS